MKYLSLLFLITVFAISVSAQKPTKKTVAPCNLSLKDAPKLRGFYLGQTVSEIASKIPGFQDSYDKDSGGYYNDQGLNFKIVHQYTLPSYIENVEEYKDVNITWQFYNNYLARIFVTYSEYEPSNLKDFINQFSDKTEIPFNLFKVTDKHKALLICNGFKVELFEGQYSRVGWSPNASQIILEDTATFAKIEKLTKEAEAEKKRQEILQKQEEIRRKKTLRP